MLWQGSGSPRSYSMNREGELGGGRNELLDHHNPHLLLRLRPLPLTHTLSSCL